jgi:3-oxoacyl-[acyl-carrier-protein] synthase II
MKKRRVVITGTGVISPVGNSTEDFWESLKAGRSGIGLLEGFEEFELPTRIVGQVKGFDPLNHGLSRVEARRNDPFSRFALAAAIEAMTRSGLVAGENIEPERLGVYIGSGVGGLTTFVNQTRVLLEEGAFRISPLFIPTMISNIGAGNVAIRFNAQGPCINTVTACATGTNSLGEAYRAIASGAADAVISGGAEAAIHPLVIGGFASAKALSTASDPSRASISFDAGRKGFVLAEGAAVLVLEEYGHALSRNAEILAEITGYAATCDAYHATAPGPEGMSASRAMRMALEESGYDAGKDSLYINAHGTGTILNDKSETKAIKLALGEGAYRVPVSSTKSMTGHMIAASGAAEAIACVMALREGILPPTIGLLDHDPECDLDYVPGSARRADIDIALDNSLGFGGHNACLVMRKYCPGL